MTVHQLTKVDFAQRRDFCKEILAILTEDTNAVVKDEAHITWMEFTFPFERICERTKLQCRTYGNYTKDHSTAQK